MDPKGEVLSRNEFSIQGHIIQAKALVIILRCLKTDY